MPTLQIAEHFILLLLISVSIMSIIIYNFINKPEIYIISHIKYNIMLDGDNQYDKNHNICNERGEYVPRSRPSLRRIALHKVADVTGEVFRTLLGPSRLQRTHRSALVEGAWFFSAGAHEIPKPHIASVVDADGRLDKSRRHLRHWLVFDKFEHKRARLAVLARMLFIH